MSVTSVAAAAAAVMPAPTVMPVSVTPAVAAVVAMARAAVVAESEIQFDGRTRVRGIAAAVIGIVAGVGRSIHRTSAESGSQQESGRASFQYVYASSSHLSPLMVNLSSV